MSRPVEYSPMTALALKSSGLTIQETAHAMGCHRNTVRSLLTMARAIEAFDLTEHDITPQNTGVFAVCTHDVKPHEAGEPFACVECNGSGLDWRPDFLNVRPLPKDRKRYAKDKLKGGK